jgi:GT2 family glycosyltransferase
LGACGLLSVACGSAIAGSVSLRVRGRGVRLPSRRVSERAAATLEGVFRARALSATIVVTTKNRRDDLRTALRSAVAQQGPVEVLVVDDGSTDGTAEMVRGEFPSVGLERSEVSRGYIAQRNEAARMATGDVVISIDDDAELRSARTVLDTLADFDHVRIGAVAMPAIDVRRGAVMRQQAPDSDGVWVTPSFWGTAHAVRRDLFLDLGGYREDLGEMFEEVDFCLRLLDAGYVTRLGRAEPLHHYESPQRLQPRKVFYVWRNNIGHAWRNVPMPYTPVRAAKVTVAGLLFGLRNRQLGPVVRGLATGYREAPGQLAGRRPVSRSAYRLDHDLRRHGPLRLEEVMDRLR